MEDKNRSSDLSHEDYTEKQIVNYQTLKSAILTKELQKEAA